MKLRAICIVILALSGLSVKAQNKWDTEVYGGVYTLNTWNCKSPDTKPEIKIGVSETYDLGNCFSLVSGLAAYKDSYNKNTQDVTTNIKAYYLQVPFNIRYTYPLGEQLFNTKLSFEIGPYVSCGIGGKTKLSTNGAEVENNTFGAGQLHHLEGGINTVVMVNFKHILFGIESRIGLSDMGYYGSDAKSKSIGVKLGYEF